MTDVEEELPSHEETTRNSQLGQEKKLALIVGAKKINK